MRNKILAVGEVLWDLLPTGKQLGGAPANFTYHCRSLGADARLVTRVGDDDLGREVLEQFRLLGLPTEPVQVDPALPTGTVAVALAPDGQPRFTIHEDVAWDRIAADEAALASAAGADAVCFGSLAQRSEPARRAIRTLVSAARPGALRVFDVNLRPPFVDRGVIADSLGLANALKLNDQELPELAAMFGLPAGVRESMAELARRFGLSLVALTRGAGGGLAPGRRRSGPTTRGGPPRCATPSAPATPSRRPWWSGASPAGRSTRSTAMPTRSPPSSARGPGARRPCPMR